MWEIWCDGELVGEAPELYLAEMFVVGFGRPCEVRRIITGDGSSVAEGGVTESVT